MKKHQTLRWGFNILFSLLLCLTLLPMTALAEEPETGVAIDETNFPDAFFRSYISTNFDTNKDKQLSDEEIAAVTLIELEGGYQSRATTLQGVAFFTELKELNCSWNDLTALDVSQNTKLEYLDCSNNELTSLDVNSNSALETLICSSNELTELNICSNLALKELQCSINGLTTLHVSNNSNLEKLYCDQNELATLQLGQNTVLKELQCFYNALTELDVSNNTKLEILYCYRNELTALDVSSNTNLVELYCDQNKLTTLKLGQNTALTELVCYSNELTALDVSDNTSLEKLQCDYNQLTELDVSNNTALKTLSCAGNGLTVLDVSQNTSLQNLNCSYNSLTALDLSSNAQLIDYTFYATDNTYAIGLSKGRTFDLSELPGNFEVSKATGWVGGTVSGTILTVDADATTVTYAYDCGNGYSATFTLDAIPKYTVTAYGLYGETLGIKPGETYTEDYAAGDQVGLQIGKRDGYTLEGLMLVGISEADLNWNAKDVEAIHRGFFFIMPENDVTVTVNWTRNSSSSGSSSSSGFSGVYNYPVRADRTAINGAAVTLDKTSAVAGDKVTITVTPDSGKAVDEVIVTDADGKTITVSKRADNQYTFIMPAGKVNIAVTTKAATYQKQIVLQIGNRNILDNNATITNDVAPIIVDNRTMVPIRVITETLDGTADWNADTRTVTLNIDGKTLSMTIGQTISGFDVVPTILNDRTYVPVRYVAEKLGANVEWIAATQQIIITK